MAVEFALTADDVAELNGVVIRRVTAFRAIMILRWTSVPLAILIFGSQTVLGVWWALVVALASIAPWVLLTRWTLRQRVIASARAAPGLLDKQTLRIAASGVERLGVISQTRYDWSSIAEVVDAPSLMLLFFNKRYALIVPKRAFAYPSEAATFVHLAREYWSCAHGHVLGATGER